jgi:uncharacterized protein YbjT (DUF2867 family)
MVVVIGGTRGTGLLIARRLAQAGRPVRVMARDPDAARPRLDATVEIVRGDLTNAATLPRAIAGASEVILTAGCRSGHYATEAQIKATEFDGVRSLLGALREAGFGGRLLYMTSSGVGTRSLAAAALNFYKGNTLRWRRRVETEIRSSGVDYTIIRAGVLLNRAGGEHALRLTQQALPLSPRYRIARADVAKVFVAALDSPQVSHATFDVVWGRGEGRQPLETLFAGIKPDGELGI